MGKISIDAFVREYKVAAKQKESVIENFVKKHIVTDYVGYIKKNVICESIIEATCKIKDGNTTLININSPNRYIFFIMKLVETYTDIEIVVNDNHSLDYYYDELNKIGAIEEIINAIPESEYTEFTTILNMKMDDLRDNEYSITALLYNLKQSFSFTGEILQEVLNNPETKKIIKEIENKNN